jgi:cation diffusion facilitator family transporter
MSTGTAHAHPHADHSHDHDADHGHDHEHPSGLRGFVTSILKPHSHDSADSIDSALESNAEGIRAVKISLVALGATAVAQLGVVLMTGSVALLADTIHNFSDALTAIPLWIAFSLARRPSNRRYTYGFGRFEDLAGMFIVAMIALSCVLAGYESIRRLLDPQDLEHVWVVLVAGVIGFAGNEIVAVYRIRVGTRIGSAALVADGLHARTDGFTSLAVAAGAIGVMLGFPLADPIVGILITIAILFVLRGAARDVYRRLMDAVDPDLLDAAEDALRGTDGVLAVTELRLRWIGHRMRAEAGVEVATGLSHAHAHAIASDAEHRLAHAVPRLDAASVRVAPAAMLAHSAARGEPHT